MNAQTDAFPRTNNVYIMIFASSIAGANCFSARLHVHLSDKQFRSLRFRVIVVYNLQMAREKCEAPFILPARRDRARKQASRHQVPRPMYINKARDK